jgi:hypothetical protein
VRLSAIVGNSLNDDHARAARRDRRRERDRTALLRSDGSSFEHDQRGVIAALGEVEPLKNSRRSMYRRFEG